MGRSEKSDGKSRGGMAPCKREEWGEVGAGGRGFQERTGAQEQVGGRRRVVAGVSARSKRLSEGGEQGGAGTNGVEKRSAWTGGGRRGIGDDGRGNHN